MKVPSRAPLTRAQFDHARLVWPVHFFEDKPLEAILAKTTPDIWDTDCHPKPEHVERIEAGFLDQWTQILKLSFGHYFYQPLERHGHGMGWILGFLFLFLLVLKSSSFKGAIFSLLL